METKIFSKKSIYILPNLFTTTSLFLGITAIIWATEGLFEQAALAIFFAALMDGLDGKVARLTNTASDFGIQYDSLADVISFGVAPAIVMWQWQLQGYERLGLAAISIFAACAALRLARFNVSVAMTNKKFFIGLPAPAAGCTLASFIFFANCLPSEFQQIISGLCLFMSISVGILMVSKVRYFSFKEYTFLKTHPFRYMLFVVLLFAVIVAYPQLLIFIVAISYIVAGLFYTFIILINRHHGIAKETPSPKNNQAKNE